MFFDECVSFFQESTEIWLITNHGQEIVMENIKGTANYTILSVCSKLIKVNLSVLVMSVPQLNVHRIWSKLVTDAFYYAVDIYY